MERSTDGKGVALSEGLGGGAVGPEHAVLAAATTAASTETVQAERQRLCIRTSAPDA